MNKCLYTFFISIVLLINGYTQPLETIKKKNLVQKFYQSKVLRSVTIPVIFIGYGISTIHNSGLPSSHRIYKGVHQNFNIQRIRIDDFLFFVPYAGLVGLKLLKVRSSNDLPNSTLLAVKSIALNYAIVTPLKFFIPIIRPDSISMAAANSFPSGHTSGAFAAATLIHKEFGNTSLWYSAGAYSVASTVGIFRILNNRHWFSDVVAGAGFGILSVNLIYLTHQYRWGKKPMTLIPLYNSDFVGFYYSFQI